jgi:hypothetical protein
MISHAYVVLNYFQVIWIRAEIFEVKGIKRDSVQFPSGLLESGTDMYDPPFSFFS